MTYRQLLKEGYRLIKSKGLEKEAIKLLTLELSGLDGTNFLLNMDMDADEETKNKILSAYQSYIDGIPVQHIIGYSYFYGYKIKVGPNVLIPRSETEELVGYVLSYFDDYFDSPVKVVDVGTGSGNIAIALKNEENRMDVYATDISNEALEEAKENAKNNGAEITFLQGNMLDPIIERDLKFDILVSNPPYIPDDEYVEPIVKDNEPNIALFGGVNGMKFYEEIFNNAHKVLNNKFIMAFEHSHKTKEDMVNLAKRYFPTSRVESIKDMQGKDRFTVVIMEE